MPVLLKLFIIDFLKYSELYLGRRVPKTANSAKIAFYSNKFWITGVLDNQKPTKI
jgi:hypothetical protein